MEQNLTKSDGALLRALINPASVALIGASGNAGKLTARPLQFLRNHHFEGQIFPVNPTRDTILGLPAFARLEDIGATVEHAYILLDAEPAIDALEECARAGVRVVTILADGFAESGDAGRARQDRLSRIARDAGILLIGPNSTGIISTHSGFCCTTNAAFAEKHLAQGKLAVLSQSGSMIGALLSRGQSRGCAFSTLVSVGNEAVAGIGTVGRILLDDPETNGFILFMETIRDRMALAAFAREAAARGKPVVAYMIGRSDEGQSLSVSHTGALTGSSAAVSAYLASIGIRQVDQFESLLDAPRVLSRIRMPRHRPRQLTVLTTTGGGGALLVDQISARGVKIAGPSDAARAHLHAKNIPTGHGKLVDVTLAGANYATMKEVVSTLAQDPETGLLLVVIGSSARFNPDLAVAPIIDAIAGLDGAAPVLAFPLPEAPHSIALLEAGGIPAFSSVETCAETIALLMAPLAPAVGHVPSLPTDTAKLIVSASGQILNEVEAGAIFASMGIATPRQVVLPPCAPLPQDLGLRYPVVAKLVSSDLPHKTEAGAIRINIRDRDHLENVLSHMRSEVEAYRPGFELQAVLIQEMAQGLGEALVGFIRDPLVGPIVTVGIGGIAAEIYRDVSLRPAPVTVETAREMVAAVRGFALLDGYRGHARGDLSALATAVASISNLALLDDVQEAEINPLLILPEGEGVTLLDALIRKT